MAHGLQQILPENHLTVVVNIGDDFEHYGLKICPDLDTVCYTLSGQANPVTGWGLIGETWNALHSLRVLGGPVWFQLGDRDLGTHLERTRRLRMGQPLSRITKDFCRSWGINSEVLPATDQLVPTIVHSLEGDLSFQEYFVYRKCAPKVTGFDFENISECVPAPGILEALHEASLVVLCPSNPFVSLDPILAVPGIKATIQDKRYTGSAVTIAISPIIGGEAVKGPAAKMFRELGQEPTAAAVAHHYEGLLDGFVLDKLDCQDETTIGKQGLATLVTDTLMPDVDQRSRLAAEVFAFGKSLLYSMKDKKGM
jgi:LPPG:FO 2-phospho-L-lactate transferase